MRLFVRLRKVAQKLQRGCGWLPDWNWYFFIIKNSDQVAADTETANILKNHEEKIFHFCVLACMSLFTTAVCANGQNERTEALLNREISVRYCGAKVSMLDET
ncbi:MAG: hypothetical protein LUG15_03905 [Oscillospiraceae bacterium]|nr:hypothetical protein [Oscillospiraceae bacterium]